MNWVRETFEDTKGEAWLGFYEGDPEDEEDKHSGMFLRNAVIYGIGMVEHYQEQIYSPLAQREVRSGTFQVRLAPIVDPSTSVGKAYDENDPSNDLDLQFTRTYGWAINDGEEWFLIEYPGNRLMWIIVAAIIFDPQVDLDKDPSRQINDPLFLSPGREYVENDLFTIINEEAII